MYQFAEWKRTSFVCTVLLLIITDGCATAKGNALTLHQVQSQDLPVLVLLALSICVAAFLGPASRLPTGLPPWWALLLFGLAISALLAAGAYAIFGNYPLARDEHMVLFDMTVYDRGRLAVPLAPFWRPYAGALVPDFLLMNGCLSASFRPISR